MKFASGFQIAQNRPSGTTATSVYTATMITEVTRIIICNTTSSAADFSLYHDDDGSTFDETSALHFAQTVPPYSTVTIEAGNMGAGLMVTGSGQIGVQTSTSNALTFTLYGITQQVAMPGRER
jgi:hypothetical protein